MQFELGYIIIIGSNDSYSYNQVRRNSCYDKAGNSSYDEAGRIGILLRILRPEQLRDSGGTRTLGIVDAGPGWTSEQ